MKRFVPLALACVLCLVATGSLAAEQDHGEDVGTPHVVPVLVSVDTQGKVTQADPAYKLRPSIKQVLHDTVQKMITKPAMHNGKPIRSQFVINLAMTTTSTHGGYNATFKYVSSKPLPNGTWHWSHDQTGRLALANQNDLSQTQELDAQSLRWDRDPFNTKPFESPAPPSNGGH